ncbi:MAG: lipoyl(octanoyl) transferase LipB [Alphaproteobacteria bacterium]|nr:MAG: lipoyl(octanoyl) transferase LipB [Alphaproteobacteria bacterium]
MTQSPSQLVDWAVEDHLVPYPEAEALMKARAAQIAAGQASELVWLLEHPPLYTAGTSARQEDLLAPDQFPVYETGRGGQYTYHGPGQRVAYVMLNLKQRKPDVRAFVCDLENWLIDTLGQFNIKGERRPGRVGIWVAQYDGDRLVSENKIAALGIRLHKWVSYHGISINVSPELSNFGGIVPCGISEHGVTSFEDLGHLTPMSEIDIALRRCFEARFGSTRQVMSPLPKQALAK